jgi:exodeoxyribonuclease V gamma subunit
MQTKGMQMSLTIYTSNRMENLIDALAGVLAEPLADAFAPEVIVVQSKGMQRWVSMELAKRFGVWANGDYPFPNAMMWRLFGLAMPDMPVDDAAFAPETLVWKIMRYLPGCLEHPEFSPLRRYLAHDADGLRLFQLSLRIADVFDQYTLFRPEMLTRWEKAGAGQEEQMWQAVLWRMLAADGGGLHRGRLKEEFCRRMRTGTQPISGMPQRIEVFGISYLPAHHLEILMAVSVATDVAMFLLSPTSEYWADIISKKGAARLSAGAALLRSEGHPLLASMGRMGRDFSDMVIDAGDVSSFQEELYEEPSGTSLLQQIQRDILNLSIPAPELKKRTIGADDQSIQVHSCHSPLREIEVLHDNLLALLETIDGLEPRDIVVMTPDIETCAPYIASVFDSPQDGVKIPYSIADRRLRSEGEIAEAMLKLLGLPGSRLDAVQLLDILAAAPVRRRFALEDNAVELIRGWVEKTCVRWGMDGKSRQDLGLPGYRENSWRAGLDRLLAGYAMPDEDGRLFNGILPFDAMEGADAATLGKLADFIDAIDVWAHRLVVPMTLVQWQEELARLLEDFIDADEGMVDELAAISGMLTQIGELAIKAGHDDRIALSVIRAWLMSRLEREERGFGFITGGVTFCAMLPMRSIPFRVVALIGMNDDAFPRRNNVPSFDLAARRPRRGDRSLRDEDRYLFLEAILSARDCLMISFTGQSIRDNSAIPPSVLVSELIDAIDRGFVLDAGGKMADHLVVKHRLQAFSSDYFSENSSLYSYSAVNFDALREGRENAREGAWAAPFLTQPLAEPTLDWRDVSLTQLMRFFDNPARFFLRQRLGIAIDEAALPLAGREPFALEGLDAYHLKAELLDAALAGGNVRDRLPVARSRGILPPAHHGEIVFEEIAGETEAFFRAVRNETEGKQKLDRIDSELSLDGFRLAGRLDDIWPGGLIRFRPAKMKARDLLHSWIEHLFLNAAGREGYPTRSLLLMTDKANVFNRVAEPLPILKTLLELYWQGLTAPLKFFPASAAAYAGGEKWSLDNARKEWAEKFNGLPGEGDDPAYRICFRNVEPLDESFEAAARTVMAPLFAHIGQ